MAKRRLARSAVAILACAGGLALATVFVLSPHSSRATDCTPAPSASDRAATSKGAVLLATLRRPRTTCDELDTQTGMGTLNRDGFGDAQSARRVVFSSRETGWLIPGDGAHAGTVCLLAHGNMGCPSVSVLRERGATAGIGWRDNEIRVQGIAVDGIDHVEIVGGDGASRNVPVIDNAFAIGLVTWPREMRVAGPHGAVTQPFGPDLSAP
jgi:hypothetical protein